MTDLSAEYYRLLTPGGYLHRAARRHRPRAGLHLGQPEARRRALPAKPGCRRRSRPHLLKSMQISAEWRAEDTRWSLTTGSGGGPYIYRDRADRPAEHQDRQSCRRRRLAQRLPPLGLGRRALPCRRKRQRPLVQLPSAQPLLEKERNIFGLSGEINSYLRANVAQPYRFTLGGPMRLSASSFDEFRGTDTYLARTGYMRRIAALPTGYWDMASTASLAMRPARSGRRNQKRFSARMASPAWWPTPPSACSPSAARWAMPVAAKSLSRWGGGSEDSEALSHGRHLTVG
jgi:NTE family protein